MSILRKYYNKVRGVTAPSSRTKRVVQEDAEAAVVGAALGGIDAQWGLDIHGVPVDLVLAGLGSAACALTDGKSPAVIREVTLGVDMQNGASTALGVFAYRKTKEWVKARKGAGK